MKKQSIAVVCTGGGTRAAYSVGVLRALAEVHGIRTPNMGLASSGGAFPLLFYLAGEFNQMYAWADLFDDDRFISFLRPWRLIDIDFLVDGIARKQVPYLCAKLDPVKTKTYISTTRVGDGQLVWFDHHDADCFEILRASAAMPLGFRKQVEIDGERYVDGGFTAGENVLIKKAFDEGADLVIDIDCSAPAARKNMFCKFLSFASHFQSYEMARIVRKYRNRQTGELTPEQQKNIIHIGPSQPLPVTHSLDRDSDNLHAGIELGYYDCANHPQLRMFTHAK